METALETDTTAEDAQTIHEHIVEIVSDSGEGAQKAGQSFGAVSAKMGNGVWTVEIIPAGPLSRRRQWYPYTSWLAARNQHGRRSRPGGGIQ